MGIGWALTLPLWGTPAWPPSPLGRINDKGKASILRGPLALTSS